LYLIKNHVAFANKFARETKVGESSIILENAKEVMTVTVYSELKWHVRNIRLWMTCSISYRFAYRFRRIRQIRCIEVEPKKPHSVWFSTHAMKIRTDGRGAFAL